MFTDLYTRCTFCFFCVYRHTLISYTMSGSNCNVYLLNAFEMLKVFLDLGHSWWNLKPDQLRDSPRTQVHTWCGVQGMCSSVSLGLTYNFQVPSCFKTATIILVPKVSHLTNWPHSHSHYDEVICIEELIKDHIISTLTSILRCLICLLAKQSTKDTISSALHWSLVRLQEQDTHTWMLYSVLNAGSPPVPAYQHYRSTKEIIHIGPPPLHPGHCSEAPEIKATNIRKDSSQAHNKEFFCRPLEILWFGI